MRERTPIVQWDNPNPIVDGVIWYSRLDDRFLVEVQQDTPDGRDGTLCIFDHKNADKLIYAEFVSVSYGAVFGPDISDVQRWAEKGIEVADKLYADERDIKKEE